MDIGRSVSMETEDTPGVLVVDDDVQVLKFVTRMLGSLGYRRVFQAASPDEARNIWAAQRNCIDLVVSDFVMPDQTGDTLVLEMQKEKAALKFLFISGNDPLNLSSVIPLEQGVNFLQKPFTVAEMRKSIDTLALCS